MILALSYLPTAIQNYFRDGSQSVIVLTYCIKKNPLGTAGVVKNAESYLDNTFVVLSGDIFAELDISDILTFHRHKRSKATIALC